MKNSCANDKLVELTKFLMDSSSEMGRWLDRGQDFRDMFVKLSGNIRDILSDDIRMQSFDGLKEGLKSMLIIAFSTGYENGHHDTVEGCFSGSGDSSDHDEMSKDWLEDAVGDGTFSRRLSIDE